MVAMIARPLFERLDDRPMAHCATLIALPDGRLLAAWFGGAYETSPDVVILGCEKPAGSEVWSEPRIIAEAAGRSLGQPVFLPRPDGTLWLFFDAIMGNDWTSAQPYRQISKDGGASWLPAEPIMDYPGLMFRSRPLVSAGRILLPAYDENTWQSRMLISDDDGVSWQLTEPISTPAGNIHPTVVTRPDGRLLAYLRTGGSGGNLWRTESSDGGETWSTPAATALPNPNSGFDLMRLQSGRLALAFNNSPSLRTPLCVALADEGEHWRWVQTFETDHAEFSYPTLAQTTDSMLHLVYTYRREHIQYASFSEAWLMQGAAYGV
ncbi:MAG: glycoside hydrolase [Anaerolineae bacterium]|nr:glycoside hydrolase [Anaerolineae bacterium]